MFDSQTTEQRNTVQTLHLKHNLALGLVPQKKGRANAEPVHRGEDSCELDLDISGTRQTPAQPR